MEALRAPRSGFWLAGRFSPRQVDWMVVSAALLLSVPAAGHAALQGGASGGVALAALPFGTVPLLWRRTHPAAVLSVLAASFATYAIVGRDELGGVGLLFGVFSAALYGNRRVRIVAGAVALSVLGLAFGTLVASDTARPLLGHVTALAVGSGVAWVLGDRTRTRRAYLAELEQRARRLEKEHDEHARRAADEERSRIARELHDVVAHSVSVIAVQAGAGRSTARSNPERSAEVLEVIERTARSALGELRALLGVLRREGEQESLRRPQPTLAHLDALVAQAREAGVKVESRVEGEVRPLDAFVDLCAYRVVQEALTNAIKHAPGARVHVLVRYAARELSITVVDDGPGPSEPEDSGHGLIGMRERVGLLGGRLDIGRDDGGGFRVQAELPITAAPALNPSALPSELFELIDGPRP